jgi:hypothetical protein
MSIGVGCKGAASSGAVSAGGGGAGSTGSAGIGGTGAIAGAAGAGLGGAPGVGDAGSDHPVTSDAAAAARAEQACRDAIIVQCLRLGFCRGYGATQESCEQYADRCPDYYFGPRTLRTVESIEACTAAIRQMTCTDIVMGLAAACLPGGTGEAGAPCSAASECASRYCSGTNPTCGTCAPPLDLGAPCGNVSEGACRSGTMCHPAKHVCVALPLAVTHARAGEPCALSGDPLIGCEGDLVCLVPRGGTTGGTCTALPAAGEPCLDSSAGPRCAAGLECGLSTADGGRTLLCGAPPPCGTKTCAANEFCFESPTVSIRCLPSAAAGEPCFDGVPEGTRFCLTGLLCTGTTTVVGDGGTGYRGTCNPPVGVADACDAVHVCREPLLCKDGHCARFDPESCF